MTEVQLIKGDILSTAKHTNRNKKAKLKCQLILYATYGPQRDDENKHPAWCPIPNFPNQKRPSTEIWQ